MLSVHDEVVGTVAEIKDWGYSVSLPDGRIGLIDRAKAPGWADDDPLLAVGNQVLVVVLDDERSPIRLSSLPVDIEIARRARRG